MQEDELTSRAPPEPRAEPLADSELGGLFDCLAEFRHVVLAVSGGADSMALMSLVARWRALRKAAGGKDKGRPEIEVVTVDHGLRARSEAEARWVGGQARAFGLRHTTLAWTGDKPKSGIEEAAREARYRLLARHAEGIRARPVAVVTAHTEDDQAETFLMRLARGSGIDGLSAMPSRRPLAGECDVELVRPLLAVAKRRLAATLAGAGGEWVEDPSNECLDFERVRLRAARGDLALLGLTSDKLGLSARRLGRARGALDQAARDLLLRAVDAHDGIFASVDRAMFMGARAELRIRLLSHVLGTFGGDAKAPRLAKIEALCEVLSHGGAGRERKVALTLGGCIVTAGSRSIHVCREQGPGDLAHVEIKAGGEALWDGRFRVSLALAGKLKAAGVTAPVVVRALGASAYATLRARHALKPRPPLRAAVTLPSFWADGVLIAVPHLVAHNFPLEPAGVRGHELCKAEFIGWPQPNEAAEGPDPH